MDSTTYTQKLVIQAAAGTLPDIILTSDGQNLPFAHFGIALNMQPYVDKDPSYNISDIYPNFLNLGRVPGNPGLYMIPFSADAVVTFYNKDMFKAAGVPFPQANWTYAQFLAAAQKLTKTDTSGKATQWGLDLACWWAAGGRSLDEGLRRFAPERRTGTQTTFSSPGSIAGWQAMQDLFSSTRWPCR